MPVLIHTHVTMCPGKTEALEAATGLKALQEHNYARLVLPDGREPKMRATENPKLILVNDFQHGDR